MTTPKLSRIPVDVEIGGVYLPSALVAAMLGIAATMLTVWLFNRYRLSRYFYYPPLVLVALGVIYTVLFGVLFLPF